MKKNLLLNNECGDTNFVSIIIVIGILLAAVLLFREEGANIVQRFIGLFD